MIDKKLLKSLVSVLVISFMLVATLPSTFAVPASAEQNVINFYTVVGETDLAARDYIIGQIASTSTFELIDPLDTDSAANAIAVRINNPDITAGYVKNGLDNLVIFNSINAVNKLLVKEALKLLYGPLIEANAPSGASGLLTKIYNYTFSYKLFVNTIYDLKTAVKDSGIFDGKPLYNPYGTSNIQVDPTIMLLIDAYIVAFPDSTPEAVAMKLKLENYKDLILRLIDAFNASLTAEKKVIINDLAGKYGGLVRLEGPRTYSDVSADSWYSNAVRFMSEQGFIKGVGNGLFSPNSKITRADFLIMVMRAYDVELDTVLTNNFSDAGNTYYTAYLRTAKRLNLAKGIGGNKFAPTASISRQDMFVILYRILNGLGKLPTERGSVTLSDYSDADQISDYALVAMRLFVETEVVVGSGDGKLTPRAFSTRAQAAQVIYNLFHSN
jgi:hypothetical protein